MGHTCGGPNEIELTAAHALFCRPFAGTRCCGTKTKDVWFNGTDGRLLCYACHLTDATEGSPHHTLHAV